MAEGLKLIMSDLIRLPRRAFFRVQHWLVFKWTGQYNYRRSVAIYCWLLSFIVIVLYGFAALLLGSLAAWLKA